MRALSLFTGVGGLDLAAMACGIEVVAMAEKDPFCRAVLAKRFAGIPVAQDVKEVEGGEWGAVDIVFGGFPCQDLSLAGATATREEKGLKASGAGSGLRCCGLFTEQDPLGYWLKTCVELLASPSIPSGLDWKMRDTPSGRSSFLLLRLARPIKESGYSLWE